MTGIARSHTRHGQRIRWFVLIFVLFPLIPLPALAASAACRVAGCVASASVRFTIVIPPRLELQGLGGAPPRALAPNQLTRDRMIRVVNGLRVINTDGRQSVAYTVGADGRVTVSLP